MKRANNPFIFCTRLNLLEISGKKAKNLKELASLIEDTPNSAVYYHTHHFLPFQQHKLPKPPNDFAYWIKNELHEDELSEKMMALDLQRGIDVYELKQQALKLIKDHITSNDYKSFNVNPEREFSFIKAKTFIIPTQHKAYDLLEFLEALKEISTDSIYFHLFGVYTLLGQHENNFSTWLKNELGEERLANRISRLDPFMFHTMEELKREVIGIVKKRVRTIIKSKRTNDAVR